MNCRRSMVKKIGEICPKMEFISREARKSVVSSKTNMNLVFIWLFRMIEGEYFCCV